MLYTPYFTEYFNNLLNIFNSPLFLFIIKVLAFTYQSFALYTIISYLRSNKQNYLYILLAITFIASVTIINLHWIITLLHKLKIATISDSFIIKSNQICWILLILGKLSISYIVSNFINKRISNIDYIEVLAGTILALIFIAISGYYVATNLETRTSIEFISKKCTYFYLFYLYIKMSLLSGYTIYYNNRLPKIKKEQLHFLLFYVFIPQFISDQLSANPFAFSATYTMNYGLKSLTTMLLTYAMHYCMRNLLKLRFLNMYDQVGSTGDYTYSTTDFKPILERMSSVTTADELRRVIREFMTATYHVPVDTITFYIRKQHHNEGDNTDASDPMYDHIEELLQSCIFHDNDVINALHEQKILIQDEIAFTQEYNPTHAQAMLLNLCRQLQVSAFIPIFQYDRLVGYILIKEHAREELFTQREQDEMLMLAHYLSNVIYLISHRNVDNVIAREKSLHAELYQRERELEQYKESMRSCFRATQDKSIGVIVYKSRRFNIRNQAAYDIAGVDPNTEKGHPLSKKLKEVVNKVELQQQRKSVSTHNRYNRKVIICAVPELESNGIIITLHYPEIIEATREHVSLLDNPQQWDYLLYLETTYIGQHLERLIPGKSEQLLQIKLSLLQAALSKYPVLIKGAREDTIDLAAFLHKASNRDISHTITLDAPERSNHVTHTLFGSTTRGTLSNPSTVEHLHEHGTLFLENMHYLSFYTQKQIGHYLQYGYFQKENSEYKLISDIRIIATTAYPVETLLEQGTLLPSFHKHFPHIISLPDLATLPENEFNTLVDALFHQVVAHDGTYRLLAFTQHDYAHLRRTARGSLYELRNGIAHIIKKKSEDNHIADNVETVHTPHEPTLFKAAQLGKEALKDRDLMIFLWNTFKSQSKIATLLNVNRSSVNRRLKQFNLNYESD